MNPFKGEVLIEDGDKRYKFMLGMYAQVVLEEIAKESWVSFWARAKEWSATDVLNLFRAGMARHQETMERYEVADLMDRLGQAKCSEIINEAINKAMPPKVEQDVKEEGASGSARPPKKTRTLQATIT